MIDTALGTTCILNNQPQSWYDTFDETSTNGLLITERVIILRFATLASWSRAENLGGLGDHPLLPKVLGGGDLATFIIPPHNI